MKMINFDSGQGVFVFVLAQRWNKQYLEISSYDICNKFNGKFNNSNLKVSFQGLTSFNNLLQL